jgi:hypothetical protein
MKIRITPVFVIRPFHFIFIKNWYSTYRWKNPCAFADGSMDYLLDIGCLTIGICKKRESSYKGDTLEKSLIRDIQKAKDRLTKKAKKQGIYKGFGLKEMVKLEDKYSYYPLMYGTPEEEEQALKLLDDFYIWCMNYTGN